LMAINFMANNVLACLAVLSGMALARSTVECQAQWPCKSRCISTKAIGGIAGLCTWRF
jgi:hypothetical protein